MTIDPQRASFITTLFASEQPYFAHGDDMYRLRPAVAELIGNSGVNLNELCKLGALTLLTNTDSPLETAGMKLEPSPERLALLNDDISAWNASRRAETPDQPVAADQHFHGAYHITHIGPVDRSLLAPVNEGEPLPKAGLALALEEGRVLIDLTAVKEIARQFRQQSTSRQQAADQAAGTPPTVQTDVIRDVVRDARTLEVVGGPGSAGS